jgi:hypothetical protein
VTSPLIAANNPAMAGPAVTTAGYGPAGVATNSDPLNSFYGGPCADSTVFTGSFNPDKLPNQANGGDDDAAGIGTGSGAIG